MAVVFQNMKHPKAKDVKEYTYEEVDFDWKAEKRTTMDCGIFLMMHLLSFKEEKYNCDLGLANTRKLYQALICANLATSDYNLIRNELIAKVEEFKITGKLKIEGGNKRTREDPGKGDQRQSFPFLSRFMNASSKWIVDEWSTKFQKMLDYMAIEDEKNMR